ncbi:MAG: hypothetical protein ACLTXL_05365 [Clostridia bacterium]
MIASSLVPEEAGCGSRRKMHGLACLTLSGVQWHPILPVMARGATLCDNR